MPSIDSFDCRETLVAGDRAYTLYSLRRAEERGLAGALGLARSAKILLENLLRNEDGRTIAKSDIEAFVTGSLRGSANQEMLFYPSRVLMQDSAGLPALVDLAAMRDTIAGSGGDPSRINPLVPVDLVIDHSVVAGFHGDNLAFARNLAEEYRQNAERYRFLKWAQQSFDRLRVVPPGTGICHQVNLEYLSRTVTVSRERIVIDGRTVETDLAYPDTLVGTDSHSTMVNALAVLGWGVGGIEAEAAMLGQPLSMVRPAVVGVRLSGVLGEGVTATDLVLTITQRLRAYGVVGKFVEFFGPGLSALTVADRATISNMAPEYGSTCGFFPVDGNTLAYLAETNRSTETLALVEAYARHQGLYCDADAPDPAFAETLEIDLAGIRPSLAGPRRPQDRIALDEVPEKLAASLGKDFAKGDEAQRRFPLKGSEDGIGHGDIVIAAITSCTNTSNPDLMIAAGLLARNAVRRGLATSPRVKTSMSPGSRIVVEYLKQSGLQDYLDRLGFNLVGLGCMTCVGNSGPLAEPVSAAIRAHDVIAAAVLSGNRNFEGRIHPDVRLNYLASPPLVVAYALAGTVAADLTLEPLGTDGSGAPVFLRDLWPTSDEIRSVMREHVTRDLYERRYADVFAGDANWEKIGIAPGTTYPWEESSTYIRRPPFFDAPTADGRRPGSITDARILGLFLDSITTDHISPVGAIEADGAAGDYLRRLGVADRDFNQYGSRRGNHEVLVRGTFANIRLKNQMVPGVEGGMTMHHPSGRQMRMFDAAMAYREEGVPLVVFAGREYGTGSARDWASKGSALLGIRAVVAQSFERIHRSNLVGMGIMPICFEDGMSWQSLGLTGKERVTIGVPEGGLQPRCRLTAEITFADGERRDVALTCRIDTKEELAYFLAGGILPYLLRSFSAPGTAS